MQPIPDMPEDAQGDALSRMIRAREYEFELLNAEYVTCKRCQTYEIFSTSGGTRPGHRTSSAGPAHIPQGPSAHIPQGPSAHIPQDQHTFSGV